MRSVGNQPDPKLIAFKREAERGALLQGPVEVGRGRGDRRQRLRVRLDRVLDDPHEPRAVGHAGAGGADVAGKAHWPPLRRALTRSTSRERLCTEMDPSAPLNSSRITGAPASAAGATFTS